MGLPPQLKILAPISCCSLTIGKHDIVSYTSMTSAHTHTHTHTHTLKQEKSPADRHMTAYSTCTYNDYLQKHNVPKNQQSRKLASVAKATYVVCYSAVCVGQVLMGI